MKVYLAGPVNGKTDDECFGWRDEATRLLAELGHEVLSPMARDYRGQEAANVEPIVHGDLDDINAADAVLVWAETPSWGTAMEVRYACAEAGKTVVAVVPEGARVSPWLMYHAAIFHTLEDAIGHLAETCA